LHQWTAHQPAVVNGAELIYQEIGVSLQTPGTAYSDAKRLSVFYQVGREGNHQGGGVPGIEERLSLYD
jgi:hypothetical protein